MFSPPLGVNSTSLCVLGAAAAVMGVLGLICRNRCDRPAWRFPLLAAAVLDEDRQLMACIDATSSAKSRPRMSGARKWAG